MCSAYCEGSTLVMLSEHLTKDSLYYEDLCAYCSAELVWLHYLAGLHPSERSQVLLVLGESFSWCR